MTENIITAGWLMTASILDIRTRRLPVWLLALGGAAAVPAAICRGRFMPEEWLGLIGGLVPGAVLLLMAAVTGKVGTADGIVLLVLGMGLGGGACLTVFMLSLLLMSVFSGILLVLRRAGRNTALPYLPFLFAAWILCRGLIS